MSTDRPSSRRRFLKTAAMAGATTTVAHALPSLPSAQSEVRVDAFELNELTIAQLQDGMKSGRFTARSLTDKHLERIDDIDRNGPGVNSVIEINPDARTIADALDRERKEKGPRGPLHGIPILIKDNLDTGDRMMTTAGSLALLGSVASKDSFVARKLREAGAVILGKTNLSEWANIRSSHSSSGWSARGGQTRNPYVLDRNPCGSSSGSGAAVSANLCAVAVGTETDGSVVCPSSANGIVGIKPTLGLVSRSGIIPIAHSQDTAGPMARTVADAAALLNVMAGPDSEDGASADSRGHIVDYTKSLDPRGLRGMRIGVVRKLFGFSEAVDALMALALETMKREGAELIDPVEIPTIGKLDEPELDLLLIELKSDLNKYLARLGPKAPVKSLKEIIDFNERNKAKEMPYFGQDMFLKAESKGPLTDPSYLEILAKCKRMSREEGIDAVMDRHKLHALVAPTGGPAWVTDPVTGDHFSGGSSQLPAMAGYPNINVPAGYVFGLPVGISFFGRAWSEPTLIGIAYAYEQASKHRRAPTFIPTLGLAPE